MYYVRQASPRGCPHVSCKPVEVTVYMAKGVLQMCLSSGSGGGGGRGLGGWARCDHQGHWGGRREGWSGREMTAEAGSE